jgi:hypothetical protein
MTERATKQSGSAGRFAWLWLIIAVLTIGGFLAWLGMNAQPGQVAVVEEVEEPAIDFGAAETVDLADLVVSAEEFVGRAIRLNDLPVSSLLGTEAFWAIAPNGLPFLVKLGDDLLERGFTVQDGEALTAIGQIHLMSEAVLDAWEEQGVLRSSDDRMMAEFATAYLEVVQARHQEASETDSDDN